MKKNYTIINMSSLDIRPLQLVCLEIFKEIQKICKKYDIKYYLDGGTMIGAIRHNGFIPWDDDLDIAMFREDYNKFLSVAQKELGDKYFLQSFETDINYPLAFAKVRKNGTYINEEQYQNLDANKGIFVDIFPVDKKPSNKFIRSCETKLLRLRYIFYCVMNKKLKVVRNKKFEKIVLLIRKISFLSSKKLLIKFSKRLQRYNYIKKPKYYGSMAVVQNDKVAYKAEWFKELVLKKFEDTEALVPVGYDELLRHTYGDYMQLPPLEKQQPSHGLNYSINEGK